MAGGGGAEEEMEEEAASLFAKTRPEESVNGALLRLKEEWERRLVYDCCRERCCFTSPVHHSKQTTVYGNHNRETIDQLPIRSATDPIRTDITQYLAYHTRTDYL